MKRRSKADDLMEKYGVKVAQARYRKDGKWYHHLINFPAALVDEHGYIIFNNVEEYNNSPFLKHKKDIHVIRNGISDIPNYINFNNGIDSDDIFFTEGAINEMNVELRNRDQSLRSLAIKTYGTTCQVCGFDFYSTYGELGRGYIEVHHIHPLSKRGVDVKTNIRDVAVVCSNCHRMIHRKGENYPSIDELRSLIKKT